MVLGTPFHLSFKMHVEVYQVMTIVRRSSPVLDGYQLFDPTLVWSWYCVLKKKSIPGWSKADFYLV
jgi:hypothetical protein